MHAFCHLDNQTKIYSEKDLQNLKVYTLRIPKKQELTSPTVEFFWGMSPQGIEPWSLDLKSDALLTTSRGQRNFDRKNFSSSSSHSLLHQVYYENIYLPKFLCPRKVVSSASDFKSRDCGSISHGDLPQKSSTMGDFNSQFFEILRGFTLRFGRSFSE